MDIGSMISWIVNDPKHSNGSHWVNTQFPSREEILGLKNSFVETMEIALKEFTKILNSPICRIVFTIEISPGLGLTRSLIRRKDVDFKGLSPRKIKILMRETADEFLGFAVECVRAQELLANSDDEL